MATCCSFLVLDHLVQGTEVHNQQLGRNESPLAMLVDGHQRLEQQYSNNMESIH